MTRPEIPPQIIEVGDEYDALVCVIDLSNGHELRTCKKVNCIEGWAVCYQDNGAEFKLNGDFKVVWGDEN